MPYTTQEPPTDPQFLSEYLSGELRRIEGSLREGLLFSNQVVWKSGIGTPEGSVVGPIGSLYTDHSGGASTTLYVKESGNGNTGWVAK